MKRKSSIKRVALPTAPSVIREYEVMLPDDDPTFPYLVNTYMDNTVAVFIGTRSAIDPTIVFSGACVATARIQGQTLVDRDYCDRDRYLIPETVWPVIERALFGDPPVENQRSFSFPEI